MGGETDGIGEPVLEWTKPDVGHGSARRTPQTSDDFNGESLGPQWQWPANPEPEWYSLTERPGHLRLYAVKNFSQEGNLWFVPNLLLQKFPAPVFMATTEVTPRLQLKGERCGLVIMGEKWSYLAVVRRETGLELAQFNGGYAVPGDATACVHTIPAPEGALHLRVRVGADAVCRFFWSRDGQNFESFGQPFTAVPGVWIGAKVGLFCLNPNIHPGRSHADFSRFTVE
jgi:beta-xylosidase